MIETHGLNHISLSVRDIDVALAFYVKLFGVREYFRDESSVQVLGPGKHDVIAFERRDHRDDRGGVHHFGFRLTSPNGIDGVVSEAVAAGGKILSQGEHGPGLPFVYVEDPDGNEIELWYETAEHDGPA